jgi:uncharacterized membrane protein
MSELVAVSYPDVYRAGEVCAALQRLQKEFLIDMEDAAYVTRERDGKIKLHQTQPVVGVAAGIGASRGTIWGALIGLLFMQPLLGMAAGAALGAASGTIAGRMADIGIPDQFMKDLPENCSPEHRCYSCCSERSPGRRFCPTFLSMAETSCIVPLRLKRSPGSSRPSPKAARQRPPEVLKDPQC